ncbi:MBL fold metallo-hydrolase [Nibricoccus sp. IMCC34717]|uniref:MBL fold metallo-hydrolase n=1 Tax=Nibricoccus sp. IMCC34717 TaxID=3034021 RepID=UPI00384D5AB6
MSLHLFPAGLIQTNAYLLADPAKGEALLIDAPVGIWEDIAPVLAREKCRLTELWFTHGHWDHMNGGAEVVRHTGAKTRAHREDQAMLETPDTMAFVMNMDIEPVKIDAWLTPGEVLSAAGSSFEVRHVPGHCPGNVLFYEVAQARAFVGDAIFLESVGRTDLPGGDRRVLENSIRTQIFTMPLATRLYPGHGPSTTVEHERENNPFVSP